MGISKSYLKELAKRKKFAQEGTEVKEDPKDKRVPITGVLKPSKDFYNKFMQSPRYNAMLAGKTFSSSKTSPTLPADYVKQKRLENLQNLSDDAYTFPTLADFVKYSGREDLLGGSQTTTGDIYLRPKYETYIDDPSQLYTHETSHSIDRPEFIKQVSKDKIVTSNRLIPTEDVAEIKKRALSSKQSYEDAEDLNEWKYLSSPTEVRARLNTVREILDKEGIDVGNKKIKKKNLKSLKKSNDRSLRELNNIFKEEDILWMLNNISKTETPQTERYAKSGAYVSTEGYKRNSPDVNNPYNVIPTNRITMKDVDFPIRAISDAGDERIIYPGEEHLFQGNYVTEFPLKNMGNKRYAQVGTEIGPITVTDPNDPKYLNYRAFKRLAEISALPSYNQRDYILEQLISNYGTSEKFNALSDEEFSKLLNTPAKYKEGEEEYENYSPDVGPYGSKITYGTSKVLPTKSKNILGKYQSDLDWLDSDLNEFFKYFPPNYYNTKDAYTPYPTANWYRTTSLTARYGSPNYWTTPKTKFIEDTINRTALKNIYPELNDGQINTWLEFERENPTYVTNVLRGKDYYSFPYYNDEPLLTRPITREKAERFSDEPNYLKVVGKPGYLPESITEDIYKKGYYLPMWNKPTQEVILSVPPTPPVPPNPRFNIQGIIADQYVPDSKNPNSKDYRYRINTDKGFDVIQGKQAFEEWKQKNAAEYQPYYQKSTNAPIDYNKGRINEYLEPATLKYQGGGTRGPIYVSNPRDPRLIRYNDSLQGYNLTRSMEPLFRVDPMNSTLRNYNDQAERFVTRTGIQPTRLITYNGDEYNYAEVDRGLMQEPYLGKFKKPVQPVMLDPLADIKTIKSKGLKTTPTTSASLAPPTSVDIPMRQRPIPYTVKIYDNNAKEFDIRWNPELHQREVIIPMKSPRAKAPAKHTKNYKQAGGTIDDVSYMNFVRTLPPNLAQPNDPSYNLRGYWNALGNPESFDYNQPTDDQGYYHAFSRDPRTGQILKAPFHPSFKEGVNEEGAYRLVNPRGDIYTQGFKYPAYEGPYALPRMDQSYDFLDKPDYEGYFQGGGKKDKSRSFLDMLPNYIPVVNDALDIKDILEGIYRGNTAQVNQGIIGLGAPGLAGKGVGEMVDYFTEKTLGKKAADQNQAKRDAIVNMNPADLRKLYTKYGPGGYDKWKAAGFPKLEMGGTIGMPRVNGQVVSSGPTPLTSVKKTRGSMSMDNEGNIKTMPTKAVKKILKNIK